MFITSIASILSIGALFLGGILPGLLIAFSLILACGIYAKRGGPAYRDAMPFSWTRLVKAFFDALPALTIPFIIVGGIVGGVFTATEAACVAVVVTVLISVFVYKELTVSDLGPLILRSVSVSAAVLIRSEEHTSELQSLMRISYAVFC